MLTRTQIRSRIHPVPQEVTVLEGAALALASDSRFRLTCPEAVKGPVKTACSQLVGRLGAERMGSDGILLNLSLERNPERPEGYCLRVDGEGVSITGHSDRGLLYGVLSFLQLIGESWQGTVLPALEVRDWPGKSLRSYRQESRWGSNVMEREDWFALIEDAARKKLNAVNITLYCCWNIQYDGKVAEYLYFPVKGYPQLQTPMYVKYYSPREGKWIEEETLPPIFRDDLFGQLVAYGQEWGVDVFPTINSMGHNTLIPRLIPETSPKDGEGKPSGTGFCTSAEETYRVLFAMYDQLIDAYLLPNGVRLFAIGMDEVREERAIDVDRPDELASPWCQCPACKGKTKQDMFVEHTIALIRYLKEKGMTSVFIYYDMLVDHAKGIGGVAQRLNQQIHDNGLQDVTVVDWWYYYDTTYRMRFQHCHDEFGLRSVCAPWNGYYNWSLMTNCVRNIRLMAGKSHEAQNGMGMLLYSAWDRSCDRLHDCFSDYCWNFAGAGSPEETARRYAQRHFAPLEEEACHGFRLMEQCTDQRREYTGPEVPEDQRILSNYDVLYRLCYYPYCYYRYQKDYPRHFPGEGLKTILSMREDYERVFYAISSMAREAAAIFRKAAQTPGCDRVMAEKLAYECENYLCLCRDWQAFLKLHDLQGMGSRQEMACIARKRWEARLELMTRCQESKDLFLQRGAAMREHSVFLQTFADIAAAAEDTALAEPDLMDLTSITSDRLRSIR